MFRRILGVATLASLVAASGCGSKSSSSVTGPGGNTPTDPAILAAATAFLPLQSGFITPSAATFASVGTLSSFIPGILAGPSPQAGPSKCRLSQFSGTTFDFTGSGYVATELPGAPVDGVRFLLYPLNAQGVPVLGTSSGHLDMSCDGTPTLSPNGSAFTFTLFANSVVVASASISAEVGNTHLVGTLTDPTGTTSIPYTSQIYESSPGQEYESFSMGPASDLTVRHDRITSTSGGTMFDSFSITPEGSTPDWIIGVQIAANLSQAISNGGLLISGPLLQDALAACIAGTLSAPVFTPQQTANCNYTPNGGTISITTADATAAQGIYRDSRRVFEVVQALGRTMHQPLPPL